MPDLDPTPSSARRDDRPGRLADVVPSPDVAALRAGRRRRRPALRAVAMGAAAVVAVAAGLGALTLRARRAADAPRSPERLWAGTLLSPIGASGATGDAERTAPFSGFALQVETEPAGAVVEVDGVVRGESPVFAGVDCAPGARVVVRARSGRAAAERTTTCRKDTLVGLTIRLGR